MKVKFKYGIKSFSGTLDGLVYSNYESRDVVIGKLYSDQTLTSQNHAIGNSMKNIASVYALTNDAFKDDLTIYAVKLYNQPEYYGKLAANKYSMFCKAVYNICNNNDSVNISSFSVDDLSVGGLMTNVKGLVEAGYLPEVDGYEDLTNNAFN